MAAGLSFSPRTPTSRTAWRRSIESNRSIAASPMRCPTEVGSGSVRERLNVVKSEKRTLIEIVAASYCCVRRRAPTRSARRRSSTWSVRVSEMSVWNVSSWPTLFSDRPVCTSRASIPRDRCQMRSPIAAPRT